MEIVNENKEIRVNTAMESLNDKRRAILMLYEASNTLDNLKLTQNQSKHMCKVAEFVEVVKAETIASSFNRDSKVSYKDFNINDLPIAIKDIFDVSGRMSNIPKEFKDYQNIQLERIFDNDEESLKIAKEISL